MSKTLVERFWEKVRKSDGCWEWIGAIFVTGYGAFSFNGSPAKAHRIAWRLTNGEIPDGKMVCHHCDNRKCVRPDHLFLGGALENNRDMTIKERHGRMLFTHAQISRIRSLYDRYRDHLTHLRIADWFGVSKATISHMMTGRNWKYANGAHLPGIRRRRYNTKLDEDKVREIRSRRELGERLQSLATAFGINQSGISKICKREKWAHVV